MADEELDAGLVERHARAWYESYADAPFYPGPWESLDDATRELYRGPSRNQLLSLPIPAAALNALARGEATVVPKLPTFEQAQAGGKADYANAILSPVCARADNAADIYTAMLAASPYATKE